MGLYQRDSENADRDISSKIAVLTDTVDISGRYIVRVMLGDGTKDLDGTGGDFSLSITVDGQTVQPDPQVVTFSVAVLGAIESLPFVALAGEEVIVSVLSPNAADTDVDVTATLHDITRALPAVAPGAENGVPTLSATLAVKANLAEILGTALTETGGYLAAGFKKLFNVATPLLVASEAMRGTEAAATAAVWTAARAGALTDWINGGRLDLILDLILEDSNALQSALGSKAYFTMSNNGTADLVSNVDDNYVLSEAIQDEVNRMSGLDGAELATLQPNYAPALAGDAMGLSPAAIKLTSYDQATAYPFPATINGSISHDALDDIHVFVRGAADSDKSAGTIAFKDYAGVTKFTYTIDANADRIVTTP